jgi:hypothetical protein
MSVGLLKKLVQKLEKNEITYEEAKDDYVG